MPRVMTPSSSSIRRIGLFFVISAITLTIAAAGTNAAGFSFMDSVKEFFGFAPAQTTAPLEQVAEPNSASMIPLSAFTPGNAVVCRIGDGSAALSNTAAAAFLDEYNAAGSLVQSIAMPTAVSGANQIFTVQGTSTNDCALTRSSDGRYLILTGYNAAVGSATPASANSTTVARMIGRVDSAGTINTTTSTTSFSAQNIRSATSDNGTNLWALGSGTGVVYTTLAGSGPGTIVSSTVTNLRYINNFGGQLYTASGAGAVRASAVGSGLPTGTGNANVNLPGMPTATAGFNGMFFADLTAAVAGVDTLYMTNDVAATVPATATSGGISKFSLVSGTWTYNGTFPVVTTPVAIPQTAFFGLGGGVSGTIVKLYATRNGTQLVTVTDATGYNAAPTANLSQLATNATNTAFRGVAFAPEILTVSSTSPTDGATNVATSSSISVTFSTTVSSSTVTAQSSPGSCTGSIQVSTDNFANCIGLQPESNSNPTFSWVPASSLQPGVTYKLKVVEVVKTASGTAMLAPYTQPTGFTTQQATTLSFTSTNPGTLAYLHTYTPSATTNSNGALSFTAGPVATCSISNGVVTMNSGTGTCTVTAQTAQTAQFAAGSATQDITAIRESPTLAFSPQPPSQLAYGRNAQLNVTGSPGGTAVSYQASGGACTVSPSGLVTMTSGSVGTCTVTASTPQTTNYEAASVQCTIAPIRESPTLQFSQPPPSTLAYGKQATLVVSGTPGGTAASFVASGGACTVTPATGVVTMTSGSVGTCHVVVSTPQTADYEAGSLQCDIAPIRESPTLTITNAAALGNPSYTGSPFTVSFTVTNTGGVASGTITPTGMMRVMSDGAVLCSYSLSASDNGAASCDVTPSSSRTYHIVADYVGDENYAAGASSPPVDHVVLPSADLSLSMTDSSDPIQELLPLTYTIMIHNNGPDTAHGISLTDLLPPGTTFESLIQNNIIPAGDDCWSTSCGSTSYEFHNTPIPAGFFDPGSEPFEGTVHLGGGNPNGTDTVVQRLCPAYPTGWLSGSPSSSSWLLTNTDPECGGPGLGQTDTTVRRFNLISVMPQSTAQVPIELVSLSLVSCQPITVRYCNGGSCSDHLWTVSVSLAPVAHPTGSMSLQRTGDYSGTTSFGLPHIKRYTFTDTEGLHAPVSLDRTETLTGTGTFTQGGGFSCTTPPVGSNGTVSCTGGTIPSGADQVISITVRPTHAVAGTTISNTASTSATESDPSSSNNSDTETTAITADTTPPVVQIVSTDPNPTTSGTTVTFHSSEAGDYEVSVGGSNCSDGMKFHIGYVVPGLDLQVDTSSDKLLRGSNTVRVCVTDAAGNTGSTESSVSKETCRKSLESYFETGDIPTECRYQTGEMLGLNGLPPGQPIRIRGSLENPTGGTTAPGGSLGGTQSQATMKWALEVRVQQVQMARVVPINDCPITIDSAPHAPNDPVQSFATALVSMQCSTTGDPDFDLLRITAGSVYNQPSPGHTTLRRVPGTDELLVDSYIDMTYTLDYHGRQGGPLGGMSGSTTGTIRMSTVDGPGQYSVCYSVDGLTWFDCPSQGWSPTIVDGLPSGVALMSDVTFSNPSSLSSTSGGSLGGTHHTFMWSASMDMAGTGDPDFDLLRTIPFSNCPVTIDTAPFVPGQPVRSFDTEMLALDCSVTGDPDFDLLRITAGSNFGLPSPGHTTLTQIPGGNWAVDSFFDITYRIDFVGHNGGHLSGHSGSTTGTIRLQQGTSTPSITVLKLDHTTGNPLPGWQMRLYGGSGCTGPILNTQTTDADGVADFIALSNGDYSVAEVMQAGWTPITPVCQDMSLGGGGGGGGFTWASGVHATLELQGMPPVHVTGNGPAAILRHTPCLGCGPGGRDYFDTEMLAMDLTSSSPIGPFRIRESPTLQSLGRVTQQTPGGGFYPADSFFDVFFELDTPMGSLHTAVTSPMDVSVFGFDPVPIHASVYRSPQSTSLPLLNAAEQPVGFMHQPIFVPMPPGEKLIVFRNQPPAPTPTYTPTPINHSITVLKINDTTGLPLSGWTMNLYSGSGCQGSALDTQVTDSNGLVDFLNLSAGSYSVGEVNQAGWTPVSGICQDTTLTGRSGGKTTTASRYDEYSKATGFTLHIAGQPPVYVTATGTAAVQSATPCAVCGPNGEDVFDTEMVSMSLTSTGGHVTTVRESPSRPSLGQIRQQQPGVNFPADSFFDVFVELDMPDGSTLHNEQPIHTQAVIDAFPPFGSTYRSPQSTALPLLNTAGQLVGTISKTVFVPLPPDEIFIVFRNQPPAPTPTNTATSTPTPIDHSITVIKLDDSTGAPLSGWTMRLYGGSGCTGPVLDSKTTASNGLAVFSGLSLSTYSVSEVNQPGWTPITPVCQDVTPSSGSGGGGGGTVGDTSYLQGGSFTIRLGFQPAGATTVTVSAGSTTVRRTEPCAGCLPGDFDTEMLSLDMQGSSALGAIHLRESPSRPSLGQIRQQSPGVVYPADSFFDVFFEFDMPDGSTLHNEAPLRMSSVIGAFPPLDSLYRSPKSSSVPLLYSSGQPAGFLDFAAHVGLPEGGALVVFSNQPPAPTPTNTATFTPTPTATNTPTCTAPDNGAGSVDLPGPCRYLGGPITLTSTTGTTFEAAGSIQNPTNVVRSSGGSLGGEHITTHSQFGLAILAGVAIPKFIDITTEADVAPRTPGQPVQSFDTEMLSLQGQLPPGDPDFDLLRITAGSVYNMPSPGHTTLIRESPTTWSVDSFFDITYRIDFTGKPGGHIGGMSGSTTGTIRMRVRTPRTVVQSSTCHPDNVNGTVDLPPPCAYTGWPASVADGLPQGTTLQSDAFFDVFTEIQRSSGGSLNGERDQFKGTFTLDMCGTGTLDGYCRSIPIPDVQAMMDSAPRTPGQTVQSFDTEMFRLVGQLPPGDPDFDLLRITAGSSFGLPSPGHTTLIRESPTKWNVDSFFDITYRIDFIGHPGSILGGHSGSTTGTIRMSAGVAGTPPTPTPTATSTSTPANNTQQGNNVLVQSPSSDASVSFSQVTTAGYTMFTPINPNSAGAPPSGYTLCPTCPAYDITTTAVYSPPVTVCLAVPSSVSASNFIRMKLLHGESGQLVDITTSHVTNPDSSRYLCGTTDHLSPFALAEAVAVTGTVTYGNAQSPGPGTRYVPNVLLSAAGSPSVSDTTGAPGTYSLSGFGAGSYIITPSKSGGVNGAITSFDAAKIAQFVTGASTLTGSQQTAADVSGTGGVTSFDAALIARYAAILPPPNGSSGTWKFSPASNMHVGITADISGEDYAALLMGDVSGNWGDPSPFRFAHGPESGTAVTAPRMVGNANGEIVVPLSIQGAANKGIISYEFNLRYDPAVIQPQANPVDLAGTASRAFLASVNTLQPGLLRVVVYGPTELENKGVLLNLRFTAVGYPGAVSPLVWEGLMFNEGEPHAVAIDGEVDLSTAVVAD